MKNIILATIVFAGATSALIPAFASSTPDATIASATSKFVAVAPERSPEQRSRFNLSDEQLEKLHAAKMQFNESNAPKIAQLKVLQEQLKDTLSKPVVDKGTALSIQSKINGVKDDLATARVSMMADTSTIFTAEQREQFRHRFLTGGSFHGRNHGRHGGHGGRQSFGSRAAT